MIQVFCEIVDCSIAILTKHVTIKQVIKIELLKNDFSKNTSLSATKEKVPKYHQMEELQQIELCWEQLLAIRHKPLEPSFWEVMNSSVLLT